MIRIPDENKQFSQSNKGDFGGTFWATKNIDIESEKGRIRISPQTRLTTDTQQRTPRGFLRSAASGTDQWWAWCGAKLFKTGSTDPTAAFAADAISNTPTDMTQVSSDIVEFGTAIIVSTSNEIKRLFSGAWQTAWWSKTTGSTLLVASVPHPLCAGFNGLLVVGDSYFANTIDKNNNQSLVRVTLKNEYEIWKILSSNSEYWILASNKYGRDARAFRWDGFSENFNQDYGLQHPVVFSGVLKNDIPYVVNGNGQLLKFTGAGFEEVDSFPIFKIKGKKFDIENSDYAIQRNGMTLVEGKINIVVNVNDLLANNIENMWSGIWTYDENEGL